MVDLDPEQEPSGRKLEVWRNNVFIGVRTFFVNNVGYLLVAMADRQCSARYIIACTIVIPVVRCSSFGVWTLFLFFQTMLFSIVFGHFFRTMSLEITFGHFFSFTVSHFVTCRHSFSSVISNQTDRRTLSKYIIVSIVIPGVSCSILVGGY